MTGLVTWTPAANQAGDYLITITAQDSRGQASQSFTLSVLGSRQVTAVTISAALGGVIAVSDPNSKINGLSLTIPARALSSDTTITVSELLSAPTLGGSRRFLQKGFVLEPNGLQFSSPVTITVPYRTSEFDTTQGIPLEDFLGVYFIDTNSGQLEFMNDFSINTVAQVVTGTVPHFSPWIISNTAQLCPPPTQQDDCPSTYSPAIPSNNLPAITVHGFSLLGMSDETTWGQLRYLLGQVGGGGGDRIDAWRFDYDSARVPFPWSGVDLAKAIHQVTVHSGKGKVNLLAHSFGGILVRTYLQGMAFRPDTSTIDYGIRNDVNRVMTLGTPHQGIGGNFSIVAADFCAGSSFFSPGFFITCFEAATGIGDPLAGDFLRSLNKKPLPNLGSSANPQYHIIIGREYNSFATDLQNNDGLITVDGANICAAISSACGSPIVMVETILSSFSYSSNEPGLCHSPALPGCPQGIKNIPMAKIDGKSHPLWTRICEFLGSSNCGGRYDVFEIAVSGGEVVMGQYHGCNNQGDVIGYRQHPSNPGSPAPTPLLYSSGIFH